MDLGFNGWAALLTLIPVLGWAVADAVAAEPRAPAEACRRVMKSHLIPVGEDSGGWKRGIVQAFKKFRDERREMICAAFEKVAGIRLFRRN